MLRESTTVFLPGYNPERNLQRKDLKSHCKGARACLRNFTYAGSPTKEVRRSCASSARSRKAQERAVSQKIAVLELLVAPYLSFLHQMYVMQRPCADKVYQQDPQTKLCRAWILAHILTAAVVYSTVESHFLSSFTT